MNKVCDEGARELFAVGEGQSTSGRCCRGKPGNEVCRTTGRRTVLAYDSIYATGHAIVNAINTGAASPESVLEVFNGVKFEGLSGAVMFDSKGERLVQYDINNLRDQASSVKYVRVGVYDPIQFEGQRLEIPDENEVVLHYEPESATAGPCWVGGDHPFRNQACKTCVRRTESKGAAGDRNSCTSCFPGSSVYPVVAGSKIGECRAAAPPFTCTSGEITQDEQAGPAMCTDRSKCRKCRGQCMGFPKESALANSLASVREGSSAPTFCPPFWQSYGSAFNFHTTEECLPKVSARLDEPGAVVTCTKMTTTWSPRYFPRNGVAPVMNDYEPVASPAIDSLGMFYTSPHNQNQYIHTELLQEAESTLDDAHVVVMDDKTAAVPKQPLQTESALPVSVPSPPMLPALRPRASAEHVLTASACQCSKRVECIQGACNSRKRCTCAETCFLTTGPNAHKDDKCKGGVLRTSLTVGLAQMAVSDLQAGDYCCYIECKVPENAPQFMRMMAKANAFCDVALTAL